jgi:hypothetical protein
MQQTLLALVALLIATFLSFNQKQAAVQNQAQVVRAEMEQMALGAARETMNVIQARAFDRATDGVPRDSIVPTSEFEEKSSIQSSILDCAAFGGTDECKDVDDFYGDIATVPFTFPTGSFEFEVNINVQYVNADLDSTAGGTKSDRKQIILEVQDNPSSGNPRLPEPIKYTEVVSYP